jgi:hypothetical protein
MAKFLTGAHINAAIVDIVKNASEELVLVSPFIKLNGHLNDALCSQLDNVDLNVYIIFGKNPEDFTKSLSKDQFDFFKEFPNIQIFYNERLHAKYYANEHTSLITSSNLYNSSQDNNIEIGVRFEKESIDKKVVNLITGTDSIFSKADIWVNELLESSELCYSKVPKFEKGLLSRRYKESLVEESGLSEYYDAHAEINHMLNKYSNLPKDGYCIRTGIKIPFNISFPMSQTAFNEWKKFENKDYKEKFCHFSGEPSNGETSFLKPILKKNWQAAAKKFSLKTH